MSDFGDFDVLGGVGDVFNFNGDDGELLYFSIQHCIMWLIKQNRYWCVRFIEVGLSCVIKAMSISVFR